MSNQYSRIPIRDRLLSRLIVDDLPGIDDAPCWLWTGATNGRGYGRIARGHGAGNNAYTHRVAYELWFGPVPAASDIDHLCRQSLCCNPAHLEAVPHPVNVRRGRAVKANR